MIGQPLSTRLLLFPEIFSNFWFLCTRSSPPGSRLFDEQLDRLLNELPPQSGQSEIEKYRQARLISEEMIVHHRFYPS